MMLAYLDFYLGGDEKRDDLPPAIHQIFPLSLVFGGDGSYMAPFILHSDKDFLRNSNDKKELIAVAAFGSTLL
nr:protein CHUP1, chloroplastic [Tanacetum cinerariifolium]